MKRICILVATLIAAAAQTLCADGTLPLRNPVLQTDLDGGGHSVTDIADLTATGTVEAASVTMGGVEVATGSEGDLATTATQPAAWDTLEKIETATGADIIDSTELATELLDYVGNTDVVGDLVAYEEDDTSVMVMAGFGTEAVNGTYPYLFTMNGRPQYAKATQRVYWRGTKWLIEETGADDYYESTDDVATPNLVTTWTTVTGSLPIGTVTAGVDETSIDDIRVLGETALQDIESESVGDLSDVVITAAADGDFLRFDGTNWVDHVVVLADVSDAGTMAGEDADDYYDITGDELEGDMDGGGNTVSDVAAYGQTIQGLTDGANIAWNMANGGFATVTLEGDRTLDNPSNLTAGATYTLEVTQDATGGRTLSFGTYYSFPGNTEPTLSSGAGDVDMLFFVATSTTELVLINAIFDIQ
jgi:hypothetical protein